MGIFSRIGSWFSGKTDLEQIREYADEVERYADRYDHARDSENAALARDYAKRILRAPDLKVATALYTEFLAIIRKEDDYDDIHSRGILRDNDDTSSSDDS